MARREEELQQDQAPIEQLPPEQAPQEAQPPVDEATIQRRRAELEQVASNTVANAERMERRKQELTAVLAQNNMLPGQVEQQLAEQQLEKRNEPKRITSEKVLEATAILEDYRKGKQNLEARIVENELWFRQQHWEQLRAQDKTYIPSSGWVFNSLANKHADMIDNLPECTCLPQEPSDEHTAELLTSILPVVLEQAHFEETYSDECWSKIKTGTGIYGVFWNPQASNGVGDIEIRNIDILSMFWEPGITDLQKSQNVFTVELWNNDALESMYPQLKDKLSTPSVDVAKYIYDDDIDTSSKSAVVDWYYKKIIGGKTVLCYVKYVNDVVLYASEDDENLNGDNAGSMEGIRGYYDHGKYPFIVDALYPEVGTFAGFGYIDIMKDNAITIDRLNAIIVRNAEQGAMRRYFVRNDTAINMDEFGDWTNPIIHVTNGNMGEEHIREYVPVGLSDVYVSVLQAKIDELKETSSNRDFSNGSTASGVTSGAAISALQEAGSKVSRDIIRGSYRAYSDICKLCIELMRQFYDVPRFFRITGDKGQTEFAQFDNSAIVAQPQADPTGVGIGDRLPVFDIKVKAHKANPFSRVAQNQDAINYFSMGFFNPQLSDQALACLDIMDIDNKEKMVQRISENGTMYDQIMQMQQLIAQLVQEVQEYTGITTEQILGAEQGQAPVEAPAEEPAPEGKPKKLAGDNEYPTVKAAKERAVAATKV